MVLHTLFIVPLDVPKDVPPRFVPRPAVVTNVYTICKKVLVPDGVAVWAAKRVMTESQNTVAAWPIFSIAATPKGQRASQAPHWVQWEALAGIAS